VSEEQNPSSASSAKARNDRVSNTIGRALKPEHVGRGRYEVHGAAEIAQAPGNQGSNVGDPLEIAAARFDGHKILQRVEERSPLLLDARANRLITLGSSRLRKKSGKQENMPWAHQ
jgi:hypothetical protein